jgi:hypothetical protein
MMTTLCATFLGWRLSAAQSLALTSDAYAEAFGLLCFLHVLLFLATLRLPWLLPDIAENGLVRERPKALQMNLQHSGKRDER